MGKTCRLKLAKSFAIKDEKELLVDAIRLLANNSGVDGFLRRCIIDEGKGHSL